MIDESDTDPGDVDDPKSYSSQDEQDGQDAVIWCAAANSSHEREAFSAPGLRIRSLLRPDETLSISGKHVSDAWLCCLLYCFLL